MEKINIVRRDELLKILKISPTTLWRWEKSGIFPEHIQIGPNIIAWREADIAEWLENRSSKTQDRQASNHARGENGDNNADDTNRDTES